MATSVNDRTNVTQSQTENDVQYQTSKQTGSAILSINQKVSFLPTAHVKVQARYGSWEMATTTTAETASTKKQRYESVIAPRQAPQYNPGTYGKPAMEDETRLLQL